VVDAAERLVNLALLMASAGEPVTAAQVRSRVAGYPEGQNETAFLRMFERDKEDLAAAGMVLVVDRSGETEAYRLDVGATFSEGLTLSAEEAMLVRVAGAASLADPSFPHHVDMSLALAKLSAAACETPVALVGDAPVRSLTADEDPERQGAAVARLDSAIAMRKHASFTYANQQGRTAVREVEPYGLFARDGRWYLVARDADADDIRVFAVTRIDDLRVSAVRPKSPDFERPGDFDVRDWMLLPFQFGPPGRPAELRFTGPAARRADVLAAPQGRLEREPDGSVTWRVPVADCTALAAWAVQHGPGIGIVSPREARTAMDDGLRKVVDSHG
jgi:predicted DNA-binding transcriptional regulator YafY